MRAFHSHLFSPLIRLTVYITNCLRVVRCPVFRSAVVNVLGDCEGEGGEERREKPGRHVSDVEGTRYMRGTCLL